MSEAAAPERRVLVYERMDPTDQSLDWLVQHGLAVTRGRPMWQQPYSRYSEAEIIAAAAGYPAVMGASGAQFTTRVIECLPELRLISKFGVGIDNIDLAAAARRGIVVANTPEDSEVVDVAEHTLATILALKKRLLQWTPLYMQQGGWRPGIFADTLAGATVGLIGLGHVGRAVAARLQGWGVRILAHDPYCAPAPTEVQLTDLHTLLNTCDIVSLHATPSSENHHMIDAAMIDLMKPTAILINTARAWLVDTPALVQALKSRRIAGAAVDVYDQEPPPPESELFRQENLVVTPHTAAWTWQGLQNIAWHGARNLAAMMLGVGRADIVDLKARL
jgi:D-3-phosphoglycerate dehydrogenase